MAFGIEDEFNSAWKHDRSYRKDALHILEGLSQQSGPVRLREICNPISSTRASRIAVAMAHKEPNPFVKKSGRLVNNVLQYVITDAGREFLKQQTNAA